MSRVFIENSSLQDIADAIRIKNGSSDEYYPSEMAQAIEDIPTGSMHDYLRFVAVENSTVSITSAVAVNFEYSTDMVTWNTWTYTESGSTRTFTTVSINAGNCIYVRGNNATMSNGYSTYTNFIMTGKIAAYGNIMYLLNPNYPSFTIPVNYCFNSLFINCTALIKAPKLPATTLTNYCYMCMFQGCTSLIDPPELPATTLAYYCYRNMFYGCTSLIDPPELPATNLAGSCYYSMFRGCTNLITTPSSLPATILYESCYSEMFRECSNLLYTFQTLPATTISHSAYANMFAYCSKLTSTPTFNVVITNPGCCMGMFGDCTSLSQANVTLSATTLSNNCYAGMFSKCKITHAPDLPAPTLVSGCYSTMFYLCPNLSSITVGAASWNTSYANRWVYGVPASGTFTKPSGTTIAAGTSGIPSGWTVVNV